MTGVRIIGALMWFMIPWILLFAAVGGVKGGYAAGICSICMILGFTLMATPFDKDDHDKGS